MSAVSIDRPNVGLTEGQLYSTEVSGSPRAVVSAEYTIVCMIS